MPLLEPPPLLFGVTPPLAPPLDPPRFIMLPVRPLGAPPPLLGFPPETLELEQPVTEVMTSALRQAAITPRALL